MTKELLIKILSDIPEGSDVNFFLMPNKRAIREFTDRHEIAIKCDGIISSSQLTEEAPSYDLGFYKKEAVSYMIWDCFIKFKDDGNIVNTLITKFDCLPHGFSDDQFHHYGLDVPKVSIDSSGLDFDIIDYTPIEYLDDYNYGTSKLIAINNSIWMDVTDKAKELFSLGAVEIFLLEEYQAPKKVTDSESFSKELEEEAKYACYVGNVTDEQ